MAAVLGVRQALRGAGAVWEAAGAALIVLVWLAFLAVAHRRIRELAAARPPGLAPRAASGVVACTVALAVFAVAVVL
ncbi:hypothetical protein [Streptomyces toxytricini]|uniref:hypothetical protein n=1 Tax=Streptomyces toxytricini TaxID=67369 RepID=UPI00343C6726